MAEPPRPLVEDSGAASPEVVRYPNFNNLGGRSVQPSVGSDQAAQRSIHNGDRSNAVSSNQEPLNANTYRTFNNNGRSSFAISVPYVASPEASGTANGVGEPGNGQLATSQDMFEEFLNAVNYGQDHFTGFGNEWQYPGLPRRPFARSSATPRTTPSHPLSVNGQPQPLYGRQAHVLPYPYQPIMQSPVNVSAQEGSQPAPTLPGPPRIYRSHSYAQPPRQAGMSPTVNQRRRHHRDQSSTPGSLSGTNVTRISSQSSRRGSRPVGEGGPQATARVSPPGHQRPQPVLQVLPRGASQTLRAAYPRLTMQQRAQVARSLQMSSVQLGELLRAMEAEDERALQMYDELLRRSYRQALNMYGSSPPSKGLDNQNDGRPEPKDAKELMVNLECKVCMSQPVDTVMLPCGHAVMCRWCADQHLSSSRPDRLRVKGRAPCPVCRAPVSQKFRIYFP